MQNFIISVVAVAGLGSFFYFGYQHFQARKLPVGMRILSLLLVVSFAVLFSLIWMLPQPLLPVVVGGFVMLGALSLYATAIRETRSAGLLIAFTNENPSSLIHTGPYRYIRHPFYSSYLIYWAGFCVATWSAWSLPVLIGMALLHRKLAIDEEEQFAQTEMSVAYAEYSRRTGRFLPRV